MCARITCTCLAFTAVTLEPNAIEELHFFISLLPLFWCTWGKNKTTERRMLQVKMRISLDSTDILMTLMCFVSLEKI